MPGPWEKFQAAPAQQGPWTKFAPQQPQAPGAVDFVSQGLSGLNEGIAMALGAPVDLMTAGINLGTTGINKLTGSEIPQIENPAGGSGTFRSMMAPAIREESDNPALKATRRVAQEVGAWAIPGAGTVSKAAKPVTTAAKELAAAIGSGTGAAIAQQAAPDNALAEFAGQIVGSMTPGGVSRAVTRKRAPPIDELRTTRDAAYEAVKKSGVAYDPKSYDKMLVDLVTDVKGDNISPTRHERAYSFITDMIGRRGNKPMTLTELDQLRQEVRRDLVTPSYSNPNAAADAHFGDKIIDAIDEMIATNGGGSETMKAARAAHSRLRKSELIEDAIVRARRRAESTGSGGNLNNAIRQNIRAILDNPKRSKAFTDAERAQMENLIKQGKLENLLRIVGKLSPSGNGLAAWFGLGAATQGLAAIPIAGLVAKALADSSTVRKADALQRAVAGAPKVKAGIRPSPAITYAQTATQLDKQGPVEITVNGGAR